VNPPLFATDDVAMAQIAYFRTTTLDAAPQIA
jgi:hypothetical protein